MFLSRAFKVLLIVIVAFVFASVATAYAEANDLPDSTYAGDGNVTISGINVTNVQYTIDLDDDPDATFITVVTLTLAPAAPDATITIKLVESGGDWYSCVNDDIPTITCDIGDLTVTEVDNLRVIALLSP